MDNRLTTKDKWEKVWSNVRLPAIRRPAHDVQVQLESYLPTRGPHSLIEIGCAPGAWMAYFHRHFGYSVAGLEYAEAAAETTKKNMQMQAIDADIRVQDFLTFDCRQNEYDVVFSAGFIEHFTDMSPVVERLCRLSREYVVTIVPNLLGQHGFIVKTLHAKVYAEHNPMDVSTLNRLHTDCGIRTLFCDYVGGIRLIHPSAHYDFFRKHKYCRHAIDGPVRIFNRSLEELCRLVHYVPRSRLLCNSLMYIGVKNED